MGHWALGNHSLIPLIPLLIPSSFIYKAAFLFSLTLFLTYPYKNRGNFPDLFTSFPPKKLNLYLDFDGK
jgi:hypothetical protein